MFSLYFSSLCGLSRLPPLHDSHRDSAHYHSFSPFVCAQYSSSRYPISKSRADTSDLCKCPLSSCLFMPSDHRNTGPTPPSVILAVAGTFWNSLKGLALERSKNITSKNWTLTFFLNDLTSCCWSQSPSTLLCLAHQGILTIFVLHFYRVLTERIKFHL